MKGKNKQKTKKKRKRNFKKHASSDEEQGEICLSCWYSLSDFFLDLSLVFSQLQVLLSYSWGKKEAPNLLSLLGGFVGLPGSCIWSGVGHHFLSGMIWQGWRLSLGYNNHRYPVSSPHPQRAV